MPSRLLSTTEAGRILGVNPSRVRQLILAGRLPATRHGARSWAIREEDLAAYRPQPQGWRKGRARKTGLRPSPSGRAN